MNMLHFLQIGDQILSINDIQLDGMSHDEVVQLLKKPGTIKLTVSHGKESLINRWLNIITDISLKAHNVGGNSSHNIPLRYC